MATLWHFSEDPAIARFAPRSLPARPGIPPRVWAIDDAHAPLYYFPRECPRVAFWALPDSTAEDLARFLGQTAARWVIAIEAAWLERLRATRLYAYRLPGATFTALGPDEGPGYYVSREAVAPLSVEPVGDLLARLVAAGVEVRLTPSLWPLYHALLPASLDYSMIRMRNAQPEAPPRGVGAEQAAPAKPAPV